MPVAESRTYTRKRDGKSRTQFTVWILDELLPALQKVSADTGKAQTKVLAEFGEARLRRVKV
jgi:hypothetical protein